MRTLLIIAGLAVMAAVGGAWFALSGIYPIDATTQHTAPVYWLLNTSMRRAVEHHAEAVRVPPLDQRALIDDGLRLYHAHCTQCHGAPGIAPSEFALGMMPVPANLALTVREWKDAAQLYWVVKHGIKMSGMPAWEFRLSETELWAIVSFMLVLPGLSPADYRLMIAAESEGAAQAGAEGDAEVAGGDPERGRIALQQYACVSCHVIPGVVGAHAAVGPSLEAIASRRYLAGVLPNTRASMIRWLRSPQTVAPGTAMPDLGVSVRDARDIAAFLETLQ